jgi:hypothetical protein
MVGRARELGVFAGAVPTAEGRTSSAQDAPVRTIVAKVAETALLTHFLVVVAVFPRSNCRDHPPGYFDSVGAASGMPRQECHDGIASRRRSGRLSGIRVGRTYSVGLSQRRRFFASDYRERWRPEVPEHPNACPSRVPSPRASKSPSAMPRNGDWPRPDEVVRTGFFRLDNMLAGGYTCPCAAQLSW